MPIWGAHGRPKMVNVDKTICLIHIGVGRKIERHSVIRLDEHQENQWAL